MTNHESCQSPVHVTVLLCLFLFSNFGKKGENRSRKLGLQGRRRELTAVYDPLLFVSCQDNVS